MNPVKFTKAAATGNDFVIIDNRSSSIGGSLSAFASNVCSRKYSIGADGLIVLVRSRKAHFRMRIFNPDGSEAEMCGNGSRCAALFAAAKHIAPRQMRIETIAGMLDADVAARSVEPRGAEPRTVPNPNEALHQSLWDDAGQASGSWTGARVKVRLTNPRDIKWDFCLTINRCPYRVSFINTGVPHVVYFVDDLDKIDVRRLGSEIRHHSRFSPTGANADFVKVLKKGRIKIRTYERGVEDETLACGTGAVASALISAKANDLASPVNVETRGGENLKVYFESTKGAFTNVYLEGEAHLVFEGVIKLCNV